MIINFAQATIKALPNGNTGMGISLTLNNNASPTPADLQTVEIDTSKLTAPQLKCLNDFIALCQSKLP
jgi:hypothetical protein